MRPTIKDVRFFFDKTIIERAISRKERKVLSGSLAFGRAVMANSIRKKGKRVKTSTPGGPPRRSVGRFQGLGFILFFYDPNSASGIVGSILFNNRSKMSRSSNGRTMSNKPVAKTVPQLVNEGGTVIRRTNYDSGHQYTKTLRYRSRPYRDLAMPKTIAKFKELTRTVEFV